MKMILLFRVSLESHSRLFIHFPFPGSCPSPFRVFPSLISPARRDFPFDFLLGSGTAENPSGLQTFPHCFQNANNTHVRTPLRKQTNDQPSKHVSKQASQPANTSTSKHFNSWSSITWTESGLHWELSSIRKATVDPHGALLLGQKV